MITMENVLRTVPTSRLIELMIQYLPEYNGLANQFLGMSADTLINLYPYTFRRLAVLALKAEYDARIEEFKNDYATLCDCMSENLQKFYETNDYRYLQAVINRSQLEVSTLNFSLYSEYHEVDAT